MPRLVNRYSFHSRSVKKTKPSVTNPILTKICVLDRLSCEGINPLLPFLEKISSSEFERAIEMLLQETIYVNRIFSDAVEFLLIWLAKSPDTLIARLKKNRLKEFFYRTEYSKDGTEWPFPKLLHAFLPILEKRNLTPDKIMNYLFNNFCFLEMPKVFIWMVIGYDQLEYRLQQVPKVFHEALLKKMVHLYHNGNNFGPRSHNLVRFYCAYGKSFEEQTHSLTRVGKFLNHSSQENRNDEPQSQSFTFTPQ